MPRGLIWVDFGVLGYVVVDQQRRTVNSSSDCLAIPYNTDPYKAAAVGGGARTQPSKGTPHERVTGTHSAATVDLILDVHKGRQPGVPNSRAARHRGRGRARRNIGRCSATSGQP